MTQGPRCLIDCDTVTCTNRPNLASQCLGLALRQLPDAWQEQHGYRPLLAESFHDPSRRTPNSFSANPAHFPKVHRKGIAETTRGARSALNCKTLRSLKDAFNPKTEVG